jgi:hypothetical protein
MIDFWDYPLALIFLASLVALVAAGELGRWLGARRAGGGGNVAALQAAVLGLLTLMISFTFAIALSRFEARRTAVLDEATSIGTVALRARLLPAPHNVEVTTLLRDYVQLRLDMAGSYPSPAALAAGLARSRQIHERLWQHATAVAMRNTAMVPTGIFVEALNTMIDDQQRRFAAVSNGVPTIVLLALYGIAVVAAGFVGYADGHEPRASRLPAYLLGATFAAVILLVLDLDRPGGGFISVSQQPMMDTAADLAGYRD